MIKTTSTWLVTILVQSDGIRTVSHPLLQEIGMDSFSNTIPRGPSIGVRPWVPTPVLEPVVVFTSTTWSLIVNKESL